MYFIQFCIILQPFRPVAQLAEHVTLNHGVEGSIPSGPTDPGLMSGAYCLITLAVHNITSL
jgi:hypothetical protein